MEMRHDNVGEVRRVVLVGRLDTAGVDVVETKFGAAIVPNGKNTIVDLSGRVFIDSKRHQRRRQPGLSRSRGHGAGGRAEQNQP